MRSRVAAWSADAALLKCPHSATWAPDVARSATARHVYTRQHHFPRPADRPSQCIGVSSLTPEGPFVDASDGPLACQPNLGGSIDGRTSSTADAYLYGRTGTARPADRTSGARSCRVMPRRHRRAIHLGWARQTITVGWRVIERRSHRHDVSINVLSGNDFAASDYAFRYATADA